MTWQRRVKVCAVVLVGVGVLLTGQALKIYKARSETLALEVSQLNARLREETQAHNEARRNAALMAEALEHAIRNKQQSIQATAEDRTALSAMQKREPCAAVRMPDDAFNVVRQAAINANVRAGRFTSRDDANSSADPR